MTNVMRQLQLRRLYYNNRCNITSNSIFISSSSLSGLRKQHNHQHNCSRLLLPYVSSLSFLTSSLSPSQSRSHQSPMLSSNNNNNNNNTGIISNYSSNYSSSSSSSNNNNEIAMRSLEDEDENDDDENEEDDKETEGIERHGINDRIITIHVSDKIFKTLKSTLQYSPVLWETILRSEEEQKQAQQNQNQNQNQNQKEVVAVDSSIFIDRDPKHFSTILTYLRNKAEGISYSSNDVSSSSSSSSGGGGATAAASAIYKLKGKVLASKDKSNVYTKYVRLPSGGGDAAELEELFIEAKYYQLNDLQKQLTHCSLAVQAMSFLGVGSNNKNKNNNPFNEVKDMIQNIRNATIMVVGTGTTIGGINWATSLSDTKDSVMSLFFGG
jgi:hypothetical protein